MFFVAITWFCHVRIAFVLVKKYCADIQRWVQYYFSSASLGTTSTRCSNGKGLLQNVGL
jgi:hypothetical protein